MIINVKALKEIYTHIVYTKMTKCKHSKHSENKQRLVFKRAFLMARASFTNFDKRMSSIWILNLKVEQVLKLKVEQVVSMLHQKHHETKLELCQANTYI